MPRRNERSAVTSAFAPASASLVAIAGAAKPEKIGTWIAPMWAHACEAIAASGAMGRKIPTTSPFRIPSAAKASASLVVSSDSSAHESELRLPSSACHTAASAPGRSFAQRCTHAWARFSRAPVNQVVHSTPCVSSRTSVQSRANGIVRSSRTARQKRSGSATETRWRPG